MQLQYTGWCKNGANGPSYLIANILKTPRPNSVEIGELLQNYMLNTVNNFLFKNFIALWRHLAKTQLLSFIRSLQIDLSITQQLCFRQVAPFFAHTVYCVQKKEQHCFVHNFYKFKLIILILASYVMHLLQSLKATIIKNVHLT